MLTNIFSCILYYILLNIRYITFFVLISIGYIIYYIRSHYLKIQKARRYLQANPRKKTDDWDESDELLAKLEIYLLRNVYDVPTWTELWFVCCDQALYNNKWELQPYLFFFDIIIVVPEPTPFDEISTDPEYLDFIKSGKLPIAWIVTYYGFNEVVVFPEKFIPRVFENSFLYIYEFCKKFFIPLNIGIIYIVYSLLYFQINFIKNLALWFLLLILVFWVMSGFNFFLKRYKFGKFTSSIQRFWKRTNMCFWLIEGFLFLLFFYYYLNSSQETVYMLDQASLSMEMTNSLIILYKSQVLLLLLIFFLFILQLNLNYFLFSQVVVILILSSIVLLYYFYLETYQIYYLFNTFLQKTWIFNIEENTWNLEQEGVRVRTKHLYFFLCLIAKYWHFMFIFLSFLFFIIKTLELKKLSHTVLALNLQNLIILYVLNCLCGIQWIKFLFRRFMDTPYFWFFTHPDFNSIYIFFVELLNIILYFFYNLFLKINYEQIEIFFRDNEQILNISNSFL